ncbi:MAG: hypothetical protein JNJ80_20285 [Gemmatimonadetes bacterium]|nr:hypothetical protein [Gemmatimonadota bacterium]
MSLHRTIHMALLIRTVLPYALLAVVGVGGIGAWAAEWFGFSYTWFTPVSAWIYWACGIAAARKGASGPLAAGMVTLLDGVAWAFGGVGPQPVPPDSTAVTKAVTVIGVTLIGAAIGWAAGRYVRRKAGEDDA